MGVTAIYARVSTDEQAEHGTGLDEQVRLCLSRVAPAERVERFVDAGRSGTTLDRPELQRLLQRARRQEVSRLVVYDPDRLSRNAAHLLLLVDELRAAGVAVEFVNFAADASPDGRLLFTVRGAISEFEAYRIKQRLYSGKQARARANRVAGGTCIFGYRLNRTTKSWEEEPREAQVVRLLFDWAVDAGTWEIAARLNAQGVAARFGGRWSQSSVIGILRNATYTGRMPQMGGLGTVAVPPLVAPAQYDAVQAALRQRLNRPPGRPRHPYLLTGRLVCGVCARAMCGGYGRPTRVGVTTYYGCSGRARPADPGARCGNRYWRSDALDLQVWEVVLRFLADPQALREAARARKEAGAAADLAGERQALLRDAERVRAERERVLRGFRRGLLTEEELVRQRQELDVEARVLEERTLSVEARMRAAAPTAADDGRAEEALGRILADAPALQTAEARRAVLAALGVRVTAGPDGAVRVRLRPDG